MFFIFGSPRSGTTLLSTTLDLHDEIVVPRETDFIVPLALLVDRVPNDAVGRKLIAELIVSTRYFPVSIGQHLKLNDIVTIVKETPYSAPRILDAIYGLLAQRAGKRIAGDKSPDDLNQITVFNKAKILPSECTKVIHIVRDVRDVTLSLLGVQWGSEASARQFPRLWSAQNLTLRYLFPEADKNYLLVRYEDMVRAPDATFRAITSFLGVEFQETMLDHSRRGTAWRHMNYHKNLQEPFLESRIGVWQRELGPDWVRLCEVQAAEGMQTFGYI